MRALFTEGVASSLRLALWRAHLHFSARHLATSLSLLRAMGLGCSSVESFWVEEGEGRSCGPALPVCQHFQQLLWATHSEIYADSRSL